MPDEKRRSFEVEGKKYAVRVPTIDEIKKANEVRATAFNEALTTTPDLEGSTLGGVLRAGKDYAGQAIDYAKTNPWEVGGAAAGAGALAVGVPALVKALQKKRRGR